MPLTSRSSENEPAAAASEHELLYRVLLRVPDTRSIPIFALGVEAGLPASDTSALTGFDALRKVVNTNVCDAVVGGAYGPYVLVDIRHRVGRAAVYSNWLAFPDQDAAAAFIRDFPRFGLNQIEQRSPERFSAKEDQLRSGAVSGRYNLGPLEHRARLKRSKEYIAVSEELEKLRDELLTIKKLRAVLAEERAVLSIG
jgi:hypothetical protein